MISNVTRFFSKNVRQAHDVFLTSQTNFTNAIKNFISQKKPLSNNPPADLDLKHIIRSQLTTRLLDLAANALVRSGQGFYSINSMGHEGMGVVSTVLELSDPKLLHYRSGAAYVELMLRAKENPVKDIINAIVCSKDSFSGGKHKVFGNKEISVIPQTSTIGSHLPKAVGLAIALRTSKNIGVAGKFDDNSVIFCSFGDGSFNHGSAQDAFNMAEWYCYKNEGLPIIFVCENNNVSISATNPLGYIEAVMSGRAKIHYLKCDGLDIYDTYNKAKVANQLARYSREAVFLDVSTVRLSSHYSGEAIGANLQSDPVLRSVALGIELGFFTLDEILHYIFETSENINQEIMVAVGKERFLPGNDIIYKYSSQYKAILKSVNDEKPISLSEAINFSIIDIMEKYPHSVVIGDDVANDDGGIYGTTRFLEKKFGNARVFNTPIAETSLLALAQMMGLNGLLPIVEVRHLAYLHNAIDQIRGEAATTRWLSNGAFGSPFFLRIPGLGYHISGGNFHNDTSIAALRDIPEIIVACVSTSSDAFGMITELIWQVLENKKIVVLIEPIELYEKKSLVNFVSDRPEDLILETRIPLGEVRSYNQENNELVVLTYGNGVSLSLEAALELEESSRAKVKVIDLRWLKPLPIDSILAEVEGIEDILIVDEGRKTASLSEELYTIISEKTNGKHKIRRINSLDEFVPLGPSAMHIFPSKDRVVSVMRDQLSLKKDMHFRKRR